MRTLIFLAVGALFLFTSTVFAQKTDTLQVKQDAMIRQYMLIGDTINYGNYAYINMHAWTHNGGFVVHRSLLEFDFSGYPFGSLIKSAQLLLYSDRKSSKYPEGHQPLTNSNTCVVSRVIENWKEYEVVWDNQPAVSEEHQVTIPESVESFQDYVVDVTEMVQDMFNDSTQSHGFLIKLEREEMYTRMVFASGDNADSTIHPRLVVTTQTVGVENVDNEKMTVKVFPNPASSQVVVELVNVPNEKYSVTLLDTRGRLVKQRENLTEKQSTFDVRNLSPGIYYVKISSPSYALVKKLMVGN